jgi:peptidyl-prolyl cis-trans isomerase SurA
MSKKWMALACCAFLSQLAYSQTLFTYGSKKVSKEEFLKAYNKNPNPNGNRKDGLNEYLNLYVNYKLKVQAAYDEKLNEQSTFKYESDNFKKQVADNIINDEANVKELVQEAFTRSQKDIHVAQVFIEVKKDADTLQAYKQIQAAYKQLKAGKDFSETVVAFSNDESTIQTKGDLGYITVFTLPYEFENEIYKLKYEQGEFSAPYKSGIGYHIFKVIGQRPAEGKRKVAQVMIAIPKDASEEAKKKFAATADSVYAMAKRGVPFEKLVNEYSTDRASLYNKGELPEISVGQYSADFDEHVFALHQPNEISKPFLTNYGWHVLKLIETTPISKDFNDPIAGALLKQQVERDNRLSIAKKNLVKKWMVISKFKPAVFDQKEFLVFTDSAIASHSLSSFKKVTPETLLFSFPKQKVTAGDWAKYIKAIKQSGSAQSSKPIMDLLREYERVVTSEYYHDHLEDFNESLKQQSKEFDEANLLFGAMDKHVWSKAGEDSIGLKNHYTKNASKYQWAPGVSALIVSCNNKDLADTVSARLKKDPVNWRNIVSNYNTNVLADSSRYEQNQLPIKQKIESQIGFISTPEKNASDDGYTFLYVTAVHSQPEQRSLDDARGMVINDYQQLLEEKWIAELKKKYPVKIDNAVWNTVK